MAERKPIGDRKTRLLADLRMAHKGADAAPDTALSQRELSARYGLSARNVSLALQELVEEGVLYTIPRVGTFFGRPSQHRTAPYVFVRPSVDGNSYIAAMQLGFEARLGHLGEATLCLTREEFEAYRGAGELASMAGVFHAPVSGEGASLRFAEYPVVVFGPDTDVDKIDFDNIGGGSMATHHLLQLGHRQIAFLGLHGADGVAGPFVWSRQREEGWRRIMVETGRDASDLAFLPPVSPPTNWHAQAAAGRDVAAHILERPDITAIITANSFAARGLLSALRESAMPAAQWPAILCFDTPEANVSVLSCLQQPWDEIGSAAAQLLWERRNGRRIGPPQERLIAMRLIPRLSCRPDWATSNLARNRAIDITESALTEANPNARLVPSLGRA